jgi:hypothetical protein
MFSSTRQTLPISMSAQIIQFPHVLEAEHRIQTCEKELEESLRRMKAEIDQMVDNHDGYKVDLFLKLIDQIIEDNHEHSISVQLLKLRYVISQYCIM